MITPQERAALLAEAQQRCRCCGLVDPRPASLGAANALLWVLGSIDTLLLSVTPIGFAPLAYCMTDLRQCWAHGFCDSPDWGLDPLSDRVEA